MRWTYFSVFGNSREMQQSYFSFLAKEETRLSLLKLFELKKNMIFFQLIFTFFKTFFFSLFVNFFFVLLFTPTKCLKGLKSRKSLFVSKF